MALNHAFGKKWDHTLNIKQVWEDAPDLPDATETARMAKEISVIVGKLRDKVENTDADLWHELDNVCDELLNIEGVENAHEARDMFNDALGHLYDTGDYGKRVWIG